MIPSVIWKILPVRCSAPTGQALWFPGIRWRIISIWTAARMQRSWHRIQKTGMRFRNRRHQRRVLPGCPQAVRTGQAAEKGEKARRAFPTAEAMRRSRSFRRFLRTFGAVKKERFTPSRTVGRTSESTVRYRAGKPRREEYLLVDGYNIIFAWEELRELAKENIHAACDKLMDILSNYQGYRKCTLILVFDAYKVEGHAEEVIPYHNIFVVYTKEAETADQYIEKTVHRIGRQYQVTVATSDGLEQVIIMGQGAHRISAMGLKKEIEDAEKAGKQEWKARRQSSKTYLFDQVSEELSARLEKVRMGQEEL